MENIKPKQISGLQRDLNHGLYINATVLFKWAKKTHTLGADQSSEFISQPGLFSNNKLINEEIMSPKFATLH